jgi:hypothetical protein
MSSGAMAGHADLLGAARAAVRADSAAWGIPARLAAALLAAPFAGAVAVAASAVHRPLFRFITHEDSLLEWSQFACYAAAAALAGLCARTLLLRCGERRAGVLFLLFAAGCVFVAGEEISWGQRIFGWGTPEALERINHQEETTLHNVGHVQDAFNLLLLCAGLYGAAAGWLAASGTRPWRGLPWYLIPPLSLSGAFVVVFAYKALRFTVLPWPRDAVVKFGEWPELCFAAALFAFALLVWRRVRRDGAALSGGLE